MEFRMAPTLLSLVSLLLSMFAGSNNFLNAIANTSVLLHSGGAIQSGRVWSKTEKNVIGLANYERSFEKISPASRTYIVENVMPVSLFQTSGGASIDFAGTDSYVDFGNPTKLHLTTYTLECWFRRDGTGKTTTTGTGGMTRVIPLVVRGSDEGETNNTNINYFLGIDSTQNVLAFDFEEGPGGSNPGLNHPLFGITPISNGVWYHAAAIYDGTTIRLYLNGTLDNVLAVARPVDAGSNAYASIGSALTSTGKASGNFNGAIDEVRIWDRALSQSEIRNNLTQKISGAANLIARWGLDEGTANTISDSALGTTPANGTVKGTGYSWTGNSPVSMNYPPDPPMGFIPANGSSGVSTSPTLNVQVSDPEKDSLTVNFYGRQKTLSFGPKFNYVVLPDTQTYTTSQSGATIFNAQVQWIVDNRVISNIPFVSHLGDITEDGGNDTDESEWIIANNAMSKLELGTIDPSDDIPFGVIPGNHDVLNGLTLYEKYFGVARFLGRPYYGGHYGSENANNYSLFNTSGLNFIVLNLNCGSSTPSSAVLSWAGGLLRDNPSRRGIVTCHYVVGSGNPGSFSSAGKAIYNALKAYPNLFLMLGGHIGNEAMRQDVYNGNTVYSLLQDFQNIGKGWLRLMEFNPASSEIHVRTYSPYLNQYQTDANSDFILHYDMGLAYTRIGSVTVPSGMGVASISWPGLGSNTSYEWYCVVTDAQGSTIGQPNSFTSAGQNQPPQANNDSYSTSENTNLVISAPGLLSNDGHSSGSTLTAVWVSNPVNGTLKLNPNGSFTYVPKANWFGTDSFTYKANDGLADSNIATVTIAVSHVNRAPQCLNVAITINENTSGQSAPNCTDAEGSPLTYSIVNQPGHGTATIAGGMLVYTPATNFSGTDTLSYKANDGHTDSNIALLNITVNPVNSSPQCSNVAFTTNENSSGQIAPNCSDAEGSPLTFNIVSQPGHGTASIDSGMLIYIPVAYYNGTDSFTYKANDGQFGSNVAAVTVTINPVNYAPLADPKSVQTEKNRPLPVTLTGSDVDGDQLTFAIVTQPLNGTLSGTPPQMTYNPKPEWTGTDSFTYQAYDGKLFSLAATVTISVIPVNTAPVCSDVNLNTSENNVGQADPICVDPEGAPLTYKITSQPGHGTSAILASKLVYTPADYYNGTDSFTYQANDGQIDSASAVVTVTISAVNYFPIIRNDNITTQQDTPVTIFVLANDSDLDQDPLIVQSTTRPSNGEVVVNSDSSITYTPNPGFLGSDSFSYVASDGNGGSASATVTIVVLAINQNTMLTYIGAVSGQYSDQVWLSAKLADESGNPVTGVTITFTIGSQGSSGTTALDGIASTSLQLNQAIGSYNVQVSYAGDAHYQASSASQPFTIDPEDAYLEYTQDLIVLYGPSNNLVATVWDSAAAGFGGVNPETGSPVMGDIRKIWVAFDIYSIANCGKNPPATTKYAQVMDTGVVGDGIGTATATTTRSENAYCVIVRLVSDSSGGTNLWYRSVRSQPGGLVAYVLSSPQVAGAGSVDDPGGGKGNFGYFAKMSGSAPAGKFFYGYRGMYNGQLADFLIQSTSITSLTTSGTAFPRTGNISGKGSLQILSVTDGSILYSSSSMTFTAVVVDTGTANDSFSLTIKINNVPYITIPVLRLKAGDEIIN